MGAGSADLFQIYSDPNLYRSIKKMYQRPTDGVQDSDILLIETQKPFELGPKFNIYAACLLDENRRSFDEIIVSGFGKTNETAELVEKIDRFPKSDLMMAIIAGHAPINFPIVQYAARADRDDLEFDTIKVKMRAISRYLTATTLKQVACNPDKQNEDIICLGQISACSGELF